MYQINGLGIPPFEMTKLPSLKGQPYFLLLPESDLQPSDREIINISMMHGMTIKCTKRNFYVSCLKVLTISRHVMYFFENNSCFQAIRIISTFLEVKRTVLHVF